MKQNMMRKPQAFTRIELALVICVTLLLVGGILPHLLKAKSAAQRISCVNNLRQIAQAYRVWAGDHDDCNPAEQTAARGGWRDYLTNADQGAICWTNYVIMCNELGQNPNPLICPADERHAAADFGSHFKDNTHISFFVGISANNTYPQSIQGGDRNLGNGPQAYRDYGFSPKSGKGNDVAVETNSSFKPVSWSIKMHSAGNGLGAGNILLGDGSAQQTTSAHFRQDWLIHAEPTTNWPAGHVPATPSIRLVFP
jgi:competence protein ComGC